MKHKVMIQIQAHKTEVHWTVKVQGKKVFECMTFFMAKHQAEVIQKTLKILGIESEIVQ